ncbi:hypothetical protein NDU88_007666 [Pleurodeles waltl]|uniref:Uncharacterized protein n=1 Tax=Pleurodeles waltl TaxID=8319 RepID=A0AAV7STG9_PLEWA|nr:hypothetical protein NDU88_007666 [Pleurodeles waltl]
MKTGSRPIEGLVQSLPLGLRWADGGGACATGAPAPPRGMILDGVDRCGSRGALRRAVRYAVPWLLVL